MSREAWRALAFVMAVLAAWGAFEQYQHARGEWNRICRPLLAWLDGRSADSDGTLELIADACLNARGAP